MIASTSARRMLLLGWLVASAGCARPSTPATAAPSAAGPDAARDTNAAVVRAIEAVLDGQRDAWNRGDIVAFMDAYVHDDTLVFTSGGTESNNLAVEGSLRAAGPGAALVTTAVEHPAVLEPARRVGGAPDAARGVAAIVSLVTGHWSWWCLGLVALVPTTARLRITAGDPGTLRVTRSWLLIPYEARHLALREAGRVFLEQAKDPQAALAPLSEVAPDLCPPDWDTALPPSEIHARGPLTI